MVDNWKEFFSQSWTKIYCHAMDCYDDDEHSVNEGLIMAWDDSGQGQMNIQGLDLLFLVRANR